MESEFAVAINCCYENGILRANLSRLDEDGKALLNYHESENGSESASGEQPLPVAAAGCFVSRKKLKGLF